MKVNSYRSLLYSDLYLSVSWNHISGNRGGGRGGGGGRGTEEEEEKEWYWPFCKALNLQLI